MSIRRLLTGMVVLLLTVSLAGCSSETSVEEGAAESDEGDAVIAPVSEVDLDWLEGEWTVLTTLVYIDNPVMEPAANQPMAEWVCEIDGSTMYLVTDMHTYEGTLTSDDGDNWKYVASSTYVDDGGIVWTSAIEVDGIKNSDDSFVGEMLGEISSDAEGHLYSAQWSLNAERMAGE
ncbi:MAG: hypothetical protein JXE06_08925 [Coriobacteriia bacterium]|nr:hypothetical protein [Coriobacteriia bacterium]MBN2821907.1 hypothetical protein [Coriobacteriia bacterium]